MMIQNALRKPPSIIRHQRKCKPKSSPGSILLWLLLTQRPTSLIPPAISPARESENYRVKQTGTRLTEAEFAEVEAAAADEGTNISAWIREAILARLSAAQRVNTDPILLAELMAIRSLILNLFAAASKGPLTDESLRKMQTYADSVKQQKADEFLTKLRAGSGAKPPKGTP